MDLSRKRRTETTEDREARRLADRTKRLAALRRTWERAQRRGRPALPWSPSKYTPHQGKRECARRRAQMAKRAQP